MTSGQNFTGWIAEDQFPQSEKILFTVREMLLMKSVI